MCAWVRLGEPGKARQARELNAAARKARGQAPRLSRQF